MHRYFQFIAALLVGFLASSAAMAHVGVHSAGGFAAGWEHPLMGLDHVLAMVAMGMWAAQRGARYLLPGNLIPHSSAKRPALRTPAMRLP
jgi:urease accessory protein